MDIKFIYTRMLYREKKEREKEYIYGQNYQIWVGHHNNNFISFYKNITYKYFLINIDKYT